MLIGCIGDDFTGSSDLANTLAKSGMRVVQYCGTPTYNADSEVEAGVIALKTRSCPVDQAVEKSLTAVRWLQKQGCTQFVFKYCSTFDSTPEGNIGPVIEALADELDAGSVVVCPAFPDAGRTVYQGHLFVDDRLLNESGMEHHPITPMTDPDIRRWLALQTDSAIGHVCLATVKRGAVHIEEALATQARRGNRLVVLDAISNEDLDQIGLASKSINLVTGGSGIALGLPNNFGRTVTSSTNNGDWHGEVGKCIALCGSCSQTTRQQIERHRVQNPVFEIDPVAIMDKCINLPELLRQVLASNGIPLIYTSSEPADVHKLQSTYGQSELASALDDFFAQMAVFLVKSGIRKILVAGGETSGAVVEGLGIEALSIGPEVDPGIPVLRASEKLVLALKSGNFGRADYFHEAAEKLGP